MNNFPIRAIQLFLILIAELFFVQTDNNYFVFDVGGLAGLLFGLLL